MFLVSSVNIHLLVMLVGSLIQFIQQKKEFSKDLNYPVHIGTEDGVEMTLDVFIAYKHELLRSLWYD